MNRFKLVLVLGVLLLLVPVALASADGGRDDSRRCRIRQRRRLDWIDPALDFISFGWQIEYATCAQLVNYPTRRRRARPSRRSRSRSTSPPTA